MAAKERSIKATNLQYDLMNGGSGSERLQASIHSTGSLSFRPGVDEADAFNSRFTHPTAFTTTKYLVNDAYADLMNL